MVSFSRRVPIPRLAVAWLAGAALMLALGVWWLQGPARDDRLGPNASIHLTRAQVLQQAQAMESPAPTMVDSHALAGLWQSVTLPFGHSSDLLDQADMTQPHATRTTWYRLAVPDFEPGAAPLMLYTARTKAYGPIAVYVDGVRVSQWQLDGALWYWDPQLIAIDAGSRLTQPRVGHPSAAHSGCRNVPHEGHASRAPPSSSWHQAQRCVGCEALGRSFTGPAGR